MDENTKTFYFARWIGSKPELKELVAEVEMDHYAVISQKEIYGEGKTRIRLFHKSLIGTTLFFDFEDACGFLRLEGRKKLDQNKKEGQLLTNALNDLSQMGEPCP